MGDRRPRGSIDERRTPPRTHTEESADFEVSISATRSRALAFRWRAETLAVKIPHLPPRKRVQPRKTATNGPQIQPSKLPATNR